MYLWGHLLYSHSQIIHTTSQTSLTMTCFKDLLLPSEWSKRSPQPEEKDKLVQHATWSAHSRAPLKKRFISLDHTQLSILTIISYVVLHLIVRLRPRCVLRREVSRIEFVVRIVEQHDVEEWLRVWRTKWARGRVTRSSRSRRQITSESLFWDSRGKYIWNIRAMSTWRDSVLALEMTR